VKRKKEKKKNKILAARWLYRVSIWCSDAIGRLVRRRVRGEEKGREKKKKKEKRDGETSDSPYSLRRRWAPAREIGAI